MSGWLGRMIQKKTDIVGDFIDKVRNHSAFQIGPRAKRIDDLEAVLRTLFASGDEHAIKMSNEIRGVIVRKHMAMEKRIAIIQGILRAGHIHLS